MRSIRVSMVLYFLWVMVVAVGAVSALAYTTTYQTLEAKEAATAQLVEAQYEERCRQESAKLDEALLSQARTLARLAQFQFRGMRIRREIYATGMLTAGPTPGGWVLAPLWIAEASRGPISGEIFRMNAEIKVNEADMLGHVDDMMAEYYFQIHSAWGTTYRSQSLEGKSFDFDPKVFALDEDVLRWEHDTTTLGEGQKVRRVRMKAPLAWLIPYAPFWPPGPPRPRPPDPAPRPESIRPDPQPPERAQPRPAIYIQCACETTHLDTALAGFKTQRDEELASLKLATKASLVDLRNRLLLISLVCFALAVAGGYWLVRLGLSPVRRLSDAVSRVSPRDFRLPIDGPSLPVELQPIAERLTQTLDLLKRAFAREKQAAADISHELRTPLAALLTTIDVALRKPRSPEQYRETLEDCRSSGQQINRLVERLLALARLDAGVDTLRAKAVDVSALAEQCVGLVRPLAEARGLSLTYHRNGPTPVTADPDKLCEVLTNLLHNAIEYNRPNGSVEVTVARENGHLEMAVRDTGIGIAPEARKQIFERFYRADPSRQADGLHAGLGLAIVKGYIDLMGGEIAVESEEGRGSTFRVRLPAA